MNIAKSSSEMMTETAFIKLLGVIGGIALSAWGAQFIALRMGVFAGYLLGLIVLIAGFMVGKLFPSEGVYSVLYLIGVLGGFFALIATENVRKKGQGGTLRAVPARAVVPQSPPPSAAHTVIHYTDNRDQSVHITQTTINVLSLSPEDARELLGLPAHFTRQRLEAAYEEKIRHLDGQAQSLPRNDAKNRLLISKQEDQLEEAYNLLRMEKS